MRRTPPTDTPAPDVPDHVVLAALDELGWPDDRGTEGEPCVPAEAHWGGARDVAAAVLTAAYQPARLGPDPLHQHACGHVECWPDRRPGMSDQTDTTPTGLLDLIERYGRTCADYVTEGGYGGADLPTIEAEIAALFDQIRQHIAELEQVAPPAGPGSAPPRAQGPAGLLDLRVYEPDERQAPDPDRPVRVELAGVGYRDLTRAEAADLGARFARLGPPLAQDPPELVVGRALADHGWYSEYDDGDECTQVGRQVMAALAAAGYRVQRAQPEPAEVDQLSADHAALRAAASDALLWLTYRSPIWRRLAAALDPVKYATAALDRLAGPGPATEDGGGPA